MVDAIWRFFSSPRLAAANAVALIAGALLGTHSVWFTLALLCALLNLLAWSLENLPGPRPQANRARIGAWIASSSLLVALAAGIVGRFTDFEGTALVSQGARVDAMTVRAPDGAEIKRRLGFFVSFDDVRIEDSEAYSELRILERLPDGAPGEELARETIASGHPLRHAGFTLHQAGYRQLDERRANLAVVDKATGKRMRLSVRGGEPIEAGNGLRYQTIDYQENHAGQGPAIRVSRTGEGGETSFWVFARAADFDRKNREDRFAFSFAGLRPTYATELRIAREPSMPVVYLGCLVFLAGAALALAGSRRRLRSPV